MKKLAKLFGFVIHCPQFKAKHYAFTYGEALSWAACYDCGASIYKRGAFVAHRKTLNHS